MQMLKKPLVKKTTRTKLSKVQQRKMNYVSEVHLEDPRSHAMEVYGNVVDMPYLLTIGNIICLIHTIHMLSERLIISGILR